MRFTPQEYTDMIIAYGLAGENTRVAARVYAERHPGRARYPTANTILRTVQRLREIGCLVHNHGAGGPRVRRRVRDEERILAAFYENSGTSVRHVARELGLSRYAVHHILRVNGLHPYHYQRVQQLLPGDAQQRINFCEGFLAQYHRDLSFTDRILWTDEATFTPNGVFNTRNFLHWDEENPHVVREGAFQNRWSINVWAGMIADQVVCVSDKNKAIFLSPLNINIFFDDFQIGPYFLPPRLNGEIYANFLETELPVLLADVPLRTRAQLIFQHDGAPAHFSRLVRDILDARYPDKWMGRGGPITWPARSPDLNVLDFFVWGHIKNLVEHRRNSRENEVRAAIVAAFGTITPEMAHRATRNIVRRAELCVQQNGRHFEQFLH